MNKIVSFLSTLLRHYIQTFKDIVKHSSIFTTLVLSVFLYSFFIPLLIKRNTQNRSPLLWWMRNKAYSPIRLLVL
jgi:hypothetical protein